MDALIQIYSLPLYIQQRTRFMLLKTTYCQVGVYSHHKTHDTRIRIKTRRHRIPNIMASIGILPLFLCRFQKDIKHKLHVTKSLNFSRNLLLIVSHPVIVLIKIRIAPFLIVLFPPELSPPVSITSVGKKNESLSVHRGK